MIRLASLAAIFALSASAVTSETVTAGETFQDRSGYPCFVTLHTDADKSVTLQLSDYKDVWSLKFVISDRASVYLQFFDSFGLRDKDAFEDAFGRVRIGEDSFDFTDTSLFVVQRQDVDEDTAGIFISDGQ